MRRIALALALVALGLVATGCSNLSTKLGTLSSAVSAAVGATVTQKQAAVLLAAYNAAEGIAVQYLALPPCKADSARTDACRDKDVAAKINDALDEGDPRADTLLADIKTARASCASASPPTPPNKCTIGVTAEAFKLLLESKNKLTAATPSVVTTK